MSAVPGGGATVRDREPAPGQLMRIWLRLMEVRVGIAPAPVLAIAAAALMALDAAGGVPGDLPTNVVLLACGGFACAEVGRRLPLLRGFGLAAILATFAPALLVGQGLLPQELVASIDVFTEQSNVLYLFIAAVVVGSILGMDRRALIGGFVRIVWPLLLGSLAAAVVGCAVGSALGLGLRHTLFKIVVPIMAGGVGEGAIPLSLGYAQLGGGSAGQRLAEILPAVMFGSLVAVLIGGALNRLGTRFPDLTGHGALEPDGPAPHPVSGPPPAHPSAEHCGAALVLALTLYLLGLLSQRAWHWPAPVVMLLLAVAVKLGGVAPPWLERGAQANYRFFAACVTYPLLFAIGVAKTPWQTLAAAFNAPTMLTIVATVTALVGTGFYTARWFRMAPIECALINACHSGQGGTGDVAILTAAGRLQLMPFAQIATRLGGALTVSLALLAFAAWKA